jgi:hypothetical protein
MNDENGGDSLFVRSVNSSIGERWCTACCWRRLGAFLDFFSRHLSCSCSVCLPSTC